MKFLWIFLLVILGAIVLLNVMCTNIIKSSQIHSPKEKNKLFLLVWGVPVLGVFLAILRINKDIRLNRKKMEEDIVPTIRKIADKIKGLEADLQAQNPSFREHKKKLH